jgi:uncharacterized protein YjbJ (UPF0337 family)
MGRVLEKLRILRRSGTPKRRRGSFLEEPIEHSERQMVDKDRIKGSANQAAGKVKEWAGKATGDSKTEAEGKADQVKGKIQNAVGGLRDALRGK